MICGDVAGLIYVWSTADAAEPSSPASDNKSCLVSTLELHSNKGAITNLVAINRPLSLFGLTANMAEYTVPQVKPLAKIAGECDQ